MKTNAGRELLGWRGNHGTWTERRWIEAIEAIEMEAERQFELLGPTVFAWLIERGQPEKQVPTVWWSDDGRWTRDANEAMRFDNKEAAERQIELLSPIPRNRPRFGRAIQHGFIAVPEAAPFEEVLRRADEEASALHDAIYASKGLDDAERSVMSDMVWVIHKLIRPLLSVATTVAAPDYSDYAAEQERARAKFGDQFDSTDTEWLAVLTEEVGEAATETLRAKFFDRDALFRRSNETGIPVEEGDFPLARLDKELVQVAAVAIRWRRALAVRLASREETGPHE